MKKPQVIDKEDSSKQKQFLMPNCRSAIKLLLQILKEYRNRSMRIKRLIPNRMGNWSTSQHDGFVFQVVEANIEIQFRYDQSIRGHPHINLVIRNNQAQIIQNIAIYWQEDSNQQAQERLRRLVGRLFISHPKVNQINNFDIFLNLPEVVRQIQQNQHVSYTREQLIQFRLRYPTYINQFENENRNRLINDLQTNFKQHFKEKELIQWIKTKISEKLEFIRNARQSDSDWLKRLIARIIAIINDLKQKCKNIQTKNRKKDDDDDYQGDKNLLLQRINKLKCIQQVAQKIQNKNNNHQQHNPSKKNIGNKDRNTNSEETKFEDIQSRLLSQSKVVQEKSKSILSQQHDIEFIIKRRRQFAFQLRKLAQEITNIVQNAGIAQTTAGGVGIASGCAVIGGVLLAPFTAGVSLALTVGGIAGGITSGATSLITGLVKNSKLGGIVEDIEKQLKDMKIGDNKLKSMVEEFHKEILRLAEEIKHYNMHQQTKMCANIALNLGGPAIKEGVKFIPNIAAQLGRIAEMAGLGAKVGKGAIEAGKLAVVGAEVFAVAGGVIGIGVGIWDVVNGISNMKTTPEDAIKVQKMAQDIDKSTEEYEKIIKTMVKAAKELC